MAIELPDLVQRIRVKTNELRTAEKAVTRLGDKFDGLRQQSADATDQMDEFADSTDHVTDSVRRNERVTAGATRALSVLRDSSEDARISMGGAGDEASRLGSSAAEAADDVGDLADSSGDAADEVTRLGKSSQETSRDNDTLSRSTKKASGELGGFVKKVLAAGGVLKILSLAIGSLKLASIVAVVGQLGSGLVSAAAGVTAFTGALGPLVGLLAAAPAGLVAFGTSALALKAIFGATGDAVEAVNKYGASSEEAAEATAGLNAQGREFVNAFAAFRGVLDNVAAGIRRAGLDEFSRSLGLLSTVLRKTKDEMGGLGEVIGGLAERGAQMVSSGPFSRDLQTILARNSTLVFTLGKAFLQLVSAVRNVTVAAGPFTQRLAEMILQASRWFNAISAANRANGDMAAFLRSTLRTMTVWGHILRDLSVGLFNVFSIGMDLGNDMTRTLEGNARAFRRFTESASGQNSILSFFDDARPALAEFGKLTTALFKEFFSLQNSINFAKSIKQIRKELLPAVGDAITYFGSSGLTGALITAATAFVRLFNTLPIDSMATLLTVVADLTNRLIDFGKANPVLLQVLATFLTLRAALKGVLIVAAGFGKLTGISAAFKAISGSGAAAKKGATGLRGFVQGLRGTEIKSKSFANKIGGVFNKGFAKISDVAKRAGSRIGPALTAGVGKARGGLVKAGKATAGAFATGFSASRDSIGRAAQRAQSVLQRGLQAAGRGATAAGRSVATAFGRGLSAIGGLASRAITGLSTAFAAIRPVVLAAAGAVRAFTLALLTNPIFLVITAIVALGAALVIAYQRSETFRKIVDATFGFIKDVVVGAVTTVVNFVRNNWKLILVAITGPIGIAVALIVKYWDQIQLAFQTAVAVIRTIITRYFTLYRTIITGAVRFIAGIIRRWWTIYSTIIRGAFNVIRSVVVAGWNFVRTIFVNAMRFIQLAVRTGMALVRTFIIEPIRQTVAVLRAIWNTIVGVFRAAIDRAVDVVRGIRDRILGFFSGAGEWLYNIGRTIVEGLVRGVTSMFQPVQDAFNWITDRIPDWKGPIGKDENLLYGAGRAIMRGLNKGIREGTGEVKSTLDGVTRDIENGIRVQQQQIAANASPLRPDDTPGRNKESRQINQTGLVKDLRSKLLRQIKQAAEQENRLRARLPLLSGSDKKIARERIRALQEEQRKLTRRAAPLSAVQDLRGERQSALRRADSFAKQARDLRLQLPDLEGEDRKKARAEIARLEEARAAEIRKARDVQTELISVFRDLPQSVRELLRDAQNERAKERTKDKRKDKDGAVGGSGGPSGTSGDPVYTSLTPGFPDPEKKYGGEKGDRKQERREQRETTRSVKRTERTMARFGKRIPDVTKDTAQNTQKVVRKAAGTTDGVIRDASGKNARTVVNSIREGRGDAKREGQETRKNAKTLSAAERAQIREARQKAADDARESRAAERAVAQGSRQHWANQNAKAIAAAHSDTALLAAAIARIRAEGRYDAPIPNVGAGRTPDNSKPPNQTTYKVTINNPKGEPSEESITKRLRQKEVLGRNG